MITLDRELEFSIGTVGPYFSIKLVSTTVAFADKKLRSLLSRLGFVFVAAATKSARGDGYARATPTAKGSVDMLYPYRFFITDTTNGKRLSVRDIVHAMRRGTVDALIGRITVDAIQVVKYD